MLPPAFGALNLYGTYDASVSHGIIMELVYVCVSVCLKQLTLNICCQQAGDL